MREDFKKWMEIPVRFRDIDTHHHVNGAMYFTYLESARVNFFDEVDLAAFIDPRKIGPAVISQTCNYRRQIFFPNVVEIGIRLLRLSEKTFTVTYELYVKGSDALHADAETTMVWIDYVNVGTLERAYASGEPWLGYLWGPSQPAKAFKLTVLTEDTYSDDCWATHKKCSYEIAKIRKAVHRVLQQGHCSSGSGPQNAPGS